MTEIYGISRAAGQNSQRVVTPKDDNEEQNAQNQLRKSFIIIMLSNSERVLTYSLTYDI